MATTRRSDQVIPEILADAIQGEFTGKNILYGSRAVVFNDSLPGTVKGGDVVTVPYFGTLGAAEKLQEGDALTPENLTATKETAAAIHIGKAFSITEWARWASYGDPYREGARQLAEVIKRAWDTELVTAASASVPSAYTFDATGLTNKFMSYDNILYARQLWGDEQENIAAITMHPDVYFDILRQKDLNGKPLVSMETSGPDGFNSPKWGGANIIISDKCAKTLVSGTIYNYESYLLKERSLVIWANGRPSVDTDRDILADATIVATHHYFVPYRYQRAPGSSKSPVIKIKTQLTLPA
jgi:hypothetical protein